MFGNKRKKDEVLETVFNEYKSDFNKELKRFIEAYLDIEKIYKYKLLSINNYKSYNVQEEDIDKKLTMKLLYIKFEKDRIENNKLEIESNVNSVLISIIVLVISVGISGLIFGFQNNIDSLKGDIENIASIVNLFFMLILLYIVVSGFILFNRISKKLNMVRIYNIAINVLNDLQKKVEKEKIASNIKNA